MSERRCAQEKVLKMQNENLRIVREKVNRRHIHGHSMEIVVDHKIRKMLYYPSDRKNTPVYFDIHGGGMAWGMMEEGDLICHRIQESLGYECYALEYPLQPQHPYPEALNWLYDTISYMVRDKEHFFFDRERIIIGGRSAGGCLTAALCLMAGKRKDFRIFCQVVDHMAIDLSGKILKEEQRYVGEETLAKELRDLLGKSYATEEQHGEALCNPVLASKEEIRRMPPAIIQTCQLDSMRLDGDIYAAMLRSEKVPVVYRCMTGAVHGVTENEGPLQEDAINFLIEGMKKIEKEIRKSG